VEARRRRGGGRASGGRREKGGGAGGAGYPRARGAPRCTRLEDAPRLRGHSKFSSWLSSEQSPRESSSESMLPNHAISAGPVQAARFFVLSPSFPFPPPPPAPPPPPPPPRRASSSAEKRIRFMCSRSGSGTSAARLNSTRLERQREGKRERKI